MSDEPAGGDERAPEDPAAPPASDGESAPPAIGITAIATPASADPELPSNLAILPSRVAVLYPGMLLPFLVSAQPWVRLLSDAVSARQPIGLFLQRDPAAVVTDLSALYQLGTAANIVRLLKLPDGSLQVLLQGAARIRLDGTPTQTEPYLRAEIVVIPPVAEESPASMEVEGLVKNLQASFQRVVQLSPVLPEEMAIAAANVDDPGRLADFVAANTDIESAQRQEILEELDPLVRARKVTELVARELEVLAIGSKIQSQIRESMDKTQRDFYLRQQLQAIRKELGETDENEVALDDLRERLAKAGLPEEASKQADREIDRLANIPTASPEHSMVRTYLEWIADLPWGIVTEDNLDLRHAKRVLDEDHFDLNRVKDRILEFLAVMKLRAERDARERGKVRGAILCLVGPPGVGKTSLGQSIGRALGRKFVHMSLGGVRDEAEIRGHRRTYIGALPGRIIQALRRAGSRNPVFILDEIDKVGNDWRGDPSSALLEVLDPAQNSDFRDHYLDLSFDLSSVLFIATANVLDTVPPALRDRLEVIDLPGYTEDDKLQIARRYLVPRQLPENGLDPEQVRISDAALRRIIREYTREAGVRNLERAIATVARKSARTIVLGEATSIAVTHRSVAELLGSAALPAGGRGARGRGRRGHGPGVHAVGRRSPVCRGARGAGQGQSDAHRATRRGHEGVRAGGAHVCQGARAGAGAGCRGSARGSRYPRARAGGSGAQGRTQCWHHHGDGHHFGPHAAAGGPQRGHDRRDNAAGTRPADRRAEGESPGGASSGAHPSGGAARQPARPGGNSGAGAERNHVHVCRSHGSGAQRRAQARGPTGADRSEALAECDAAQARQCGGRDQLTALEGSR